MNANREALYPASALNDRNGVPEIRQAPLPKANDPYEWTGWPLFERYRLAGSGGPVSRKGARNRTRWENGGEK